MTTGSEVMFLPAQLSKFEQIASIALSLLLLLLWIPSAFTVYRRRRRGPFSCLG